MVSQVVKITGAAYSALLDQSRVREAEGQPIFTFTALPTAPGSLSVHVPLPKLGYGSPAPAGLPDFVLLLTLANIPDPQFRPLPLPDDVAVAVTDRLEAAIAASIMDLNGHDRMALAAAFEQARKGETAWPPHGRKPESDYERHLVEAAIRAQSELQEKLNALDVRHVKLREAAIRTGMLGAVRRLAHNGPVGDGLHLVFSERHGDVAIVLGDMVEELRRATDETAADAATTAQSYVRRLRRDDLAGIEVRPFWIDKLLLDVAPDIARQNMDFLWRSHDESRIVDGDAAVAARELDQAMHEYCKAFDSRLLTRFHPIVRAALAVYEFLRIEPGAEGNEKVAAHVFQGILDADNFFALPLGLVIHREWRNVVDNFAQLRLSGSPEVLAWSIVYFYEMAVELGERIMSAIPSVYAEVRSLLIANGVEADDAGLIAALVVSEAILDPQHFLVESGGELVDAAPILQAAGIIERLELDGETHWSPKLARRFASQWSVWPSTD
jgi:hypothetical protein